MLNLHNHSNYSILQSSISIDSLIAFAKNHGSNYVSLTDTNGMHGLIQFAKQAEEAGIKPILGAYIDESNNPNDYVVFLAKNNYGYSELCKVITSRKLEEDFSLIKVVQNISDNLFVLISSLQLLKEITTSFLFPQNLYVELIATKKQKRKTRELYNYAKENKLQIIASHPAYFLNKEDYILQKTVTAIKSNSTLENLDEADIIDEEYYLKTPTEIKKIWKALPEAIWNVEDIAKSCNVNLEFGKNKFPVFPLPKGENASSYLEQICNKGLTKRYEFVTEHATARLAKELSVIEEMGFSHYFLVVHDIVREAKLRQMRILGRGSAANSLVSYCLGFTEIDPIKHNLYFERFLNRARTSPPDVDLDFSWRERDEIIKYIYDKYGYDKVAMISTTVTFRARSAFREVAKVFGVSQREISKFSKFIPWTSAKNLVQLAAKFPESKSLDFSLEPWKTIIQIASRLAGFPRHRSIHPSGIVVTEKPMTNYVPLEYAKNKGLGLIITQADMYSIEDLGLVKIDILSQRSLEVLTNTMRDLQEEYVSPKRTQSVKIIPINSLDENLSN
ncbi:MAG: PHP domain-containing protein [Melioribacteraceae bacterium]